ncbi:MAG: transcription-repair coupling factor, partial [Chloroflexi bacterium]|nr:transcription-repair coupling factor [Chloroflexota bacterium]
MALLEGAKPFLVAALWRDMGVPVLWLVPQPDEARRLYDQLLPWLPVEDRAHVLLYPEPDALPYERLTTDASTTRDRLRVLTTLALGMLPRGGLVVSSAYAAAQVTLDPAVVKSESHVARVGQRLRLEEFTDGLVGLGYEPVQAIEVPGTFSRRGGILDVWPPASEEPVRIELFGDVVDSIRRFAPATQRSEKGVGEVLVSPAREVLPRTFRALATHPSPMSASEGRRPLGGSREEGWGQMAPEVKARFEEELGRLAEGVWVEEGEFYGPLVNRHTLLDHLPRDTFLVVDRPKRLRLSLEELEAQGEEIKRGLVTRGQLPADYPSPLLSSAALLERLDAFPRRLALDPFGSQEERDGGGEGGEALVFTPAPVYGGRMEPLVRDVKERRRRKGITVLVSQQAERLSEVLDDAGITAVSQRDLTSPLVPGAVAVVHDALAEGWALSLGATPESGLLLLTDAEVYGFVRQARPRRRRAVRRDTFLSEIGVGDYLVHIEHGIGRFLGTRPMEVEGGEREYLVLQYASGDTLYVPTDQLDRVSRYFGTGGSPELTRLGTQDWARTKRRAKEAALAYAAELLEVYASRELAPGIALSADTPWQGELEASFPYVETPDQLRVIEEVKEDMEGAQPMDRLICGDVGYGKTEVALRAAFKAVMGGMQVAVLVPTTILAQQHDETFRQRLASFPVRVEMLSRFRTKEQQDAVVAGLKDGSVDIVIGTHRLLQKDIGFKNLGLLIVDEEQRFGVFHKEQLKRLRSEVDVLTLTATPIPRTLHMALVGVRDMSTIETPPEERLPIKTFVAEYDERLVREAVLREMDRGGQVFYLHNRIFDIEREVSRLRELVPEARIAAAHGRMVSQVLEKTMAAFARGEADVLVCTTIIQAGLDLPNANTLLVDEADKLGLAQLYQLRGRVGRSSLRAYAYFFYRSGRVITERAERRLDAILSATELGAGFRIAMRDLEIRGAGNLLGPQQSWHIAAVGFDLYTRLLAEAV